MTHQIPVRPDFSQLQNQAKELLRAHKGSDDTCCQTLRLLSELSEASDSQIFGTKIGLRKVQHALALDYGFQSWADLKQHVETTNALDTQLEFLPEIGFNYSDQQRRTEIREAIDIASRFEGKELAAKALMTAAKVYGGWCMEVAPLGSDGWNQAIRLYERVIEEYPNTPSATQAKWWLASCYGAWAWAFCCMDNQGKQDWDTAAEKYLELYESAQDPGSKCDALRRYAEIQLHCLGEWREGLKNYRRLIDEFPEDPEESPYRTCRTCGGIFNGTSLIDYNIMLPGGPNSANSHHGLLSEAKTPEDAIALSKEFIQLAPELDTIRYHGLYQLAGSLRRLGDSRKADEAMAELGLCDRWLVAGPFHTKGDDSRRMVFEAELDALRGSVDVTKEYPAATEDGRDGIAMWSRTSSVSGDEVLETHPRYHFVTAVGAIYALTNVTCPRPRKAQIRVGTSGQCRVWISGRVVPTGEVQELPSALVDANVWPIDLQAGEHQLLIRFDLSGNYGSNQNYVRLTTRDGHRLKDISYSVPAVSDDNRSRSTFMK